MTFKTDTTNFQVTFLSSAVFTGLPEDYITSLDVVWLSVCVSIIPSFSLDVMFRMSHKRTRSDTGISSLGIMSPH